MAEQNGFLPNVGFNDLLEAGLHFGHQAKRWNPKMKRFVFAKRNGIYIIDLSKTLFHLKLALEFVHGAVSDGKKVVFVGTKKLTQDIIKEAAVRCGQHYVVSRWLGGALTNHRNIKTSIARMRKIEALEETGAMADMPQKEASRLRGELGKLHRYLVGIADMPEMPGALVVFDISREAIAVREANRVGVPVIALVDTNCDPDPIDYPIPGNDDALRCVKLIINLFAETIEKASARQERKAAEGAAQEDKAGPEREKKANLNKRGKHNTAVEIAAESSTAADSGYVSGVAENAGN